jgi:hypothetical protein
MIVGGGGDVSLVRDRAGVGFATVWPAGSAGGVASQD